MRGRVKENKNKIGQKIDYLREVTAALLDEVRNLSSLKTVNLEGEVNFNEEVRRFQIYLIEHALKETGGNQKEAARWLNINPTTLNAKIKRYNINERNLSKREF